MWMEQEEKHRRIKTPRKAQDLKVAQGRTDTSERLRDRHRRLQVLQSVHRAAARS